MHVVATSIDKYHISSSTAREECEMDTLYKTNIHAVRMFLQFISATETTSKTTIVGTSLSPESAVSLTTAVWFSLPTTLSTISEGKDFNWCAIKHTIKELTYTSNYIM